MASFDKAEKRLFAAQICMRCNARNSQKASNCRKCGYGNLRPKAREKRSAWLGRFRSSRAERNAVSCNQLQRAEPMQTAARIGNAGQLFLSRYWECKQGLSPSS